RPALASFDDLQQPRAEPTGEHQPRPAVSEVWRHPGDERAEPFALQRAVSQAAAALFTGPQLPQLVLLRKVDRQRQRDPDQRRRFADTFEQLRPGARDRTLGVRLPPPLDHVVAVGPAVRHEPADAESRRRRGMGSWWLATGR